MRAPAPVLATVSLLPAEPQTHLASEVARPTSRTADFGHLLDPGGPKPGAFDPNLNQNATECQLPQPDPALVASSQAEGDSDESVLRLTAHTQPGAGQDGGALAASAFAQAIAQVLLQPPAVEPVPTPSPVNQARSSAAQTKLPHASSGAQSPGLVAWAGSKPEPDSSTSPSWDATGWRAQPQTLQASGLGVWSTLSPCQQVSSSSPTAPAVRHESPMQEGQQVELIELASPDEVVNDQKTGPVPQLAGTLPAHQAKSNAVSWPENNATVKAPHASDGNKNGRSSPSPRAAPSSVPVLPGVVQMVVQPGGDGPRGVESQPFAQPLQPAAVPTRLDAPSVPVSLHERALEVMQHTVVRPERAGGMGAEQSGHSDPPLPSADAPLVERGPVVAQAAASPGIPTAKTGKWLNTLEQMAQTTANSTQNRPQPATVAPAPAPTAPVAGRPPSYSTGAKPDLAPLEAGVLPAAAVELPVPETPSATPTQSSAPPPPNVEAVHARIVNAVASLKQLKPDTIAVRLTPDADTVLRLRLQMHQGQVTVHAQLERGDFAGLSVHWAQLQQRLGAQGIQLSQLQPASVSPVAQPPPDHAASASVGLGLRQPGGDQIGGDYFGNSQHQSGERHGPEPPFASSNAGQRGEPGAKPSRSGAGGGVARASRQSGWQRWA